MSDSDSDSDLDALRRRIERLEDELEIRELLSTYGYHADAGRDEDYLHLWTEDGRMNLSTAAQDGPAYRDLVEWVGQEQLRAFIEDEQGHHMDGFYKHSLHVQGNNVSIRIDGDEAVALSYSILLHQVGAEVRTLGAGVNRWLFRRVDGRWRIHERRRREVGHPETADVLSWPADAS